MQDSRMFQQRQCDHVICALKKRCISHPACDTKKNVAYIIKPVVQKKKFCVQPDPKEKFMKQSSHMWSEISFHLTAKTL